MLKFIPLFLLAATTTYGMPQDNTLDAPAPTTIEVAKLTPEEAAKLKAQQDMEAKEAAEKAADSKDPKDDTSVFHTDHSKPDRQIGAASVAQKCN